MTLALSASTTARRLFTTAARKHQQHPRAAVAVTVTRISPGAEGANHPFSDDISEVLLVQRSKPPHRQGSWSLPGGSVEWGETTFAAAVRELEAETGLGSSCGDVDFQLDGRAFTVSDAIYPASHSQIAQLWARSRDGAAAEAKAKAADDAKAVRWFTVAEIESGDYDIGGDIASVLQELERQKFIADMFIPKTTDRGLVTTAARKHQQHPRAAVAVTVTRAPKGSTISEVLLVQKSKPPHREGSWSLPGGSVEWGETTFAAAVRELEAETGLSRDAPGLSSSCGDVDFQLDGRAFTVSDAIYPASHSQIAQLWARSRDGAAAEAKAKAADDAKAVRWFTVAEIESGDYDIGGDIASVLQELERQRAVAEMFY